MNAYFFGKFTLTDVALAPFFFQYFSEIVHFYPLITIIPHLYDFSKKYVVNCLSILVTVAKIERGASVFAVRIMPKTGGLRKAEERSKLTLCY